MPNADLYQTYHIDSERYINTRHCKVTSIHI